MIKVHHTILLISRKFPTCMPVITTVKSGIDVPVYLFSKKIHPRQVYYFWALNRNRKYLYEGICGLSGFWVKWSVWIPGLNYFYRPLPAYSNPPFIGSSVQCATDKAQQQHTPHPLKHHRKGMATNPTLYSSRSTLLMKLGVWMQPTTDQHMKNNP